MSKKPMNEALKEKVRELEKTNEELRENEKLFKQYSRATSEGIIIHENGILIMANDQFYRILGYKSKELLGENAIEMCVAPEDQERMIEQIKSGQKGPYEVMAVRKDGHKFPVEIRAQMMEYKGRMVRFGAIRDMSEHKLAEDALRESEKKFRSIFEKASDEIIYLTTEGIIVDVNNKIEEIFGYKKEEVIGEKITSLEILNAEDIARNDEMIKAAIDGNAPQLLEFKCKHKNGSPVYIEASLSAIKKGGMVTGILSIVRDVTNRKTAKKELQKREKDLQKTSDALEILLEKSESRKKELEEDVLSNIKKLLSPCIEKLKKTRLNTNQANVVQLLETNLNTITSALIRKTSLQHFDLSPMEIQVASLVKQGKRNKEMAIMLGISKNTVLFHRYNLRTKLGVRNKKINLKIHLNSLDTAL